MGAPGFALFCSKGHMVRWWNEHLYWTDEMLELMVGKLTERKKRELEAMKGHTSEQVVSEDRLFNEAGIKVKKVKHGD